MNEESILKLAFLKAGTSPTTQAAQVQSLLSYRGNIHKALLLIVEEQNAQARLCPLMNSSLKK